MKTSRRQSREFALKGLYQWLFTAAPADEIARDLAELEGYANADESFLKAELAGVIAEAAQLQALLEPLADRRWAEVSPVERAILLIGAWEMVHVPKVPYRVAINEAIELAKRYGGTDGHKYVNGILDRVAASVRSDEVAAVVASGRRARQAPKEGPLAVRAKKAPA